MNSGTGAPGLTAVLLVVVAVIAVTLAWTGLRAAARRRSPDREGARGVPPDEFAGETTAALNTRASASLVAIDDAITTSGQELGFAQAQFGAEATATFEVALTAARTSVARAFALRQQLDDAFPETEQQARAMASEIIRICSQVSADLDSHTHEFEALRDLQAHAPDLLDDVARQATEAGARVSAARVTLAGLSASYPATALASISANPDQVERLVAGITSTVTAGRAALATGDRAAAVAAARSGQAALAQAMSLLDAVGQAGANLAAAGRRLTSSIAVLNQDVIDAARLAPSDPEVVAQVAVATAAIAEAQRAAAGADPLEALRAVTRTQGELGARLAPYREQAEHAEAARKQLTDLLGHATAQIGAVSDYIDTRRGAVGPEARTRLAEAARHARQAQDLAGTDPVQALSEATQANQLVNSAQTLAQQDVADFEAQQRRDAGGPTGGSMGGPGGMVLGGILIDQLLRGGGRGFGGGFGGGC
ncbi:hypothetical protein [Cellulomonas sp. P24]|jgi:hypothetical protein|uniref:hypothetical protein n=1 Tax=Cellulomonas sp. P24 TaxID=2885206 RepID=UPI00216AB85E|nr:hypothetical protein [Cellulomonas sp. P24]MCR6492046.1 hypothetical protein [Cellulomonas sp. P24]